MHQDASSIPVVIPQLKIAELHGIRQVLSKTIQITLAVKSRLATHAAQRLGRLFSDSVAAKVKDANSCLVHFLVTRGENGHYRIIAAEDSGLILAESVNRFDRVWRSGTKDSATTLSVLSKQLSQTTVKTDELLRTIQLSKQSLLVPSNSREYNQSRETIGVMEGKFRDIVAHQRIFPVGVPLCVGRDRTI